MLHPPVLDLSLPLFVPPVPFDTVVEIRYSSLASLIFLIWDICVTFDQEVEFIWKQHARFPVKWLFLFVRYWAVVIQTLIFLTATGGITNIGLRADQCETWYSFQSFATQSLTIAVEMILMLRVYALYNRSRAMRILMLAILAIEVAFVVPVYVIYVPRVKYGIQCSATTTQDSKALFVSISTASILIQFILSGFTLVKTAGAIKSGWGRTPVMIILMRDGSWVFLIQFGAMMLNAIHTVQVGPIKGHIVFTWFWAILSFSRRVVSSSTSTPQARKCLQEIDEDDAVPESLVKAIPTTLTYPPANPLTTL
ncbi:hypothetical protein JAAARDRAFT_40194 [Jaapia argillacea MUCL 33604]|uniref:DUF6533 domain-containing protein n=1 Tax=Jaapia argillacea MUCL 33604 TaxID=933084 RepID=A0A067PFH5_9AGAM|nr:hypothetical protein JAAARDRAFT_40194 [Jaapia argillacea MUCL 33604]